MVAPASSLFWIARSVPHAGPSPACIRRVRWRSRITDIKNRCRRHQRLATVIPAQAGIPRGAGGFPLPRG